ncbi:hypothetical protein llap_6809 [Limosa lapponica baueri]|uniref:Ig-like domain-containing protein n=1 Tax=Limosa lapponica baueri TaxID=1758121 RepID=A0A2I0UA02_LIMLA|nr:hypothetical protein llap_6809 [Limosa lapponica baueri]
MRYCGTAVVNVVTRLLPGPGCSAFSVCAAQFRDPDVNGSTVSEPLVKGKVGQDITVPCFYRVKNREDITSMCWGRDKCPTSKCSRTIIWTDGWKVTERSDSRYKLKGNLQMGDVSLTIVNAVEADSGTYCCRVEISGWFNDQLRNYDVVVEKAPGSTNESSFTITRTWPPVSASEAPQTVSISVQACLCPEKSSGEKSHF